MGDISLRGRGLAFKNGGIDSGCVAVMSDRRKVTKVF